MTLTKEELAARLTGREYTEEISDEEILLAKQSGLVVIYGASDDLMEIEGAIRDEAACYNGGKLLIGPKGVLQDWPVFIEGGPTEQECHDYFRHKEAAKVIEAVWDSEGYSWTYKTDVPHATFEVLENGEKYCRGIVIDVRDLNPTNEKERE